MEEIGSVTIKDLIEGQMNALERTNKILAEVVKDISDIKYRLNLLDCYRQAEKKLLN